MLGLYSASSPKCGKRRWGIGLGHPVVAPRRVITLPTDAEQRQRLLAISRSRTEPTGRVERARIILAYLQDPSAYAVARTTGVTQQTMTRCLERAAELGVIEALDDRPRAGRDPVITAEAKTWLVGWPRGWCARSWPSKRSSRTGCATTWNSAIPSSSPRWPRSFVFTDK